MRDLLPHEHEKLYTITRCCGSWFAAPVKFHLDKSHKVLQCDKRRCGSARCSNLVVVVGTRARVHKSSHIIHTYTGLTFSCLFSGSFSTLLLLPCLTAFRARVSLSTCFPPPVSPYGMDVLFVSLRTLPFYLRLHGLGGCHGATILGNQRFSNNAITRPYKSSQIPRAAIFSRCAGNGCDESSGSSTKSRA